MKKILGMITVLALAAGIATNATAKMERKDQPNRRFVEEVLEKVGEAHFPEKMKVKRISSVEVGETYYHVFQGELDTVGYRIIVFDNYRNYLGYYRSDFPPCNEEKENSIVVDSGTVDDAGEPLYYPIPINPKKGLPAKIQIAGIPISLVKAPVKETEGADAGEGGVTPEFRDWHISKGGKVHTARAIYLKQGAGKVFLRLESTGQEGSFPLHTLSKEDQEYVRQFK